MAIKILVSDPLAEEGLKILSDSGVKYTHDYNYLEVEITPLMELNRKMIYPNPFI